MTQRGAPRRALWAAQAMILAVALWARLSRVGEVFVGNETIPVEQDCYYHLRRILMTAGDFPHAPIRDPLINWPHGADCGWAPGFDQLGALAVLASGASSSAAGARVAALLPVALGAGCVLATMWLVRTVLERHPRRDWIALGAGWLLSILPQAVATSRVGRIDHHVAEALLVALLCGWAARRGAAVGAPREGAAGRGDVGFEVAGAGLLIAAVHVFAGSVLYAAVAAIVLIGAAIAEPRPAALRRALVGSGAPAFAGAAAALALLARPQVAAHGRAFSHLYPSFMQPALIALAAAAIALATATPLLVRAAPGADRVSPGEALRRIGAFAAGAIALVAITAILLPRARGEVFSGLSGWLAKEDPYMASIDETRPMLLGMSPLDPAAWGRVYSYFGVVGLLAPVTLPVAIVAAVRRDRGPGASFAAFTLAIAGLTLAQSRFGRELVVLLSVATALALDTLAAAAWSRVRPGIDAGARASIASAIALGAALLAILDPALRVYLPPMPPPPVAALPAAALFLRDHAPRAPAGEGAGVLAPWDMGFAILHLGQRPVVVSGFGPYLSREAYDEVERAWRGTEAELLALMDRRDLGFVVAGASSYLAIPSPEGEAPFVRAADGRGLFNGRYFQRVPLAPLIVGGSGAPDLGVPHLAHLLPRFASAQRVGGLDAPIPRLWVYERVPGARLTGPADGRVVARVALESAGKRIEYVAWAEPRDGRFSLTIPLPTGFAVGEWTTGPEYRIQIGGNPPAGVPVPEGAVRSGAEINAP